MNRLIFKNGFLIAITFLIGVNLRPILASISPIIPVLQNNVGISNQVVGLLTTFPILMMGFFALLAPTFQSKLNEYSGIVIGLLAIAIGCSVRIFTESSYFLLFTSVIGGIGIALIQTLMPAYLKRIKPNTSSTFMAFFTTGIMAGAAISSAISSPLETIIGWRYTLSSMAIPAFLVFIICIFSLQSLDTNNKQLPSLPFKSLNAWLLTIFFGIGTGAYTLVLAWLPLNYIQLGWSRDGSGLLLSILTIAEVASGFIVSAIISKYLDRRIPIFVALGLILVGLVLILTLPSKYPYITVITLGFGIGALFPLSLIVALDYTTTPSEAVSLLALVQGGGYLIASLFPYLAGLLIDLSGSLNKAWSGMLFGVICLFLISIKFSPQKLVIKY